MRVACIVLLVARLNFYTLLIYARNLHDDEVVFAKENFNVNASAPNSLTVTSYASDRKPTMVTPVVVYCNRYAILGTDFEKFHRILHQKLSLLERQVVCLVVVTSEFKIRDRCARHRTCRVRF